MPAEWARVLAFKAQGSSLKFELFAMRPVWRNGLALAVVDVVGRSAADTG
jgi:hypothetical protein